MSELTGDASTRIEPTFIPNIATTTSAINPSDVDVSLEPASANELLVASGEANIVSITNSTTQHNMSESTVAGADGETDLVSSNGELTPASESKETTALGTSASATSLPVITSLQVEQTTAGEPVTVSQSSTSTESPPVTSVVEDMESSTTTESTVQLKALSTESASTSEGTTTTATSAVPESNDVAPAEGLTLTTEAPETSSTVMLNSHTFDLTIKGPCSNDNPNWEAVTIPCNNIESILDGIENPTVPPPNDSAAETADDSGSGSEGSDNEEIGGADGNAEGVTEGVDSNAGSVHTSETITETTTTVSSSSIGTAGESPELSAEANEASTEVIGTDASVSTGAVEQTNEIAGSESSNESSPISSSNEPASTETGSTGSKNLESETSDEASSENDTPEIIAKDDATTGITPENSSTNSDNNFVDDASETMAKDDVTASSTPASESSHTSAANSPVDTTTTSGTSTVAATATATSSFSTISSQDPDIGINTIDEYPTFYSCSVSSSDDFNVGSSGSNRGEESSTTTVLNLVYNYEIYTPPNANLYDISTVLQKFENQLGNGVASALGMEDCVSEDANGSGSDKEVLIAAGLRYDGNRKLGERRSLLRSRNVDAVKKRSLLGSSGRVIGISTEPVDVVDRSLISCSSSEMISEPSKCTPIHGYMTAWVSTAQTRHLTGESDNAEQEAVLLDSIQSYIKENQSSYLSSNESSGDDRLLHVSYVGPRNITVGHIKPEVLVRPGSNTVAIEARSGGGLSSPAYISIAVAAAAVIAALVGAVFVRHRRRHREHNHEGAYPDFSQGSGVARRNVSGAFPTSATSSITLYQEENNRALEGAFPSPRTMGNSVRSFDSGPISTPTSPQPTRMEGDDDDSILSAPNENDLKDGVLGIHLGVGSDSIYVGTIPDPDTMMINHGDSFDGVEPMSPTPQENENENENEMLQSSPPTLNLEDSDNSSVDSSLPPSQDEDFGSGLLEAEGGEDQTSVSLGAFPRELPAGSTRTEQSNGPASNTVTTTFQLKDEDSSVESGMQLV